MRKIRPQIQINYPFLIWILFGVCFAFIIKKAFTIPITHDEVATAIHYYRYSVWEIMMYPDNWPNNHILNTLAAKFFISIFGQEVWAIRIPNLISFVLLTIGIFRISSLLFGQKKFLFVIAGLLFLSNNYFLDFFSVCRGYGMSSSLLLLSISFLFTGFKGKKSHIWLSFMFSLLASYANFTLLTAWVGNSFLILIFFLYQKEKRNINIFLLFLTSLLYLGLIYTPIKKMTSTNQFTYWSSKGFYHDTILSLVKNSEYGWKWLDGINSNIIGYGIVLFYISSITLVIFRLIHQKFSFETFQKPDTIIFTLITTIVVVNLSQTFLLETPNLNGRTALFFFPLFIIAVLSILSNIQSLIYTTSAKYVVFIFLFALPIIYLIMSYQTKNVREWWYDENTLEVVDFLNKKENGNSFSLQLHWMFKPSFSFYKETNKIDLNLIKVAHELNPNTEAKYYYAFEKDYEILKSNFNKLKEFKWGRWIYVRKKMENKRNLNGK